ncbi:LysR substrate-binding domain-containing protein [Amycolatopsis minnesotensis]|uniref:LysR substrate-binding domain-containing protein n=1 Tax=Amycolatopsis minnesotensis TaxID=337894 RepID=A0ABN2RUK6_9PSEU
MASVTLEDLRVFAAVCATGSLSAVAREQSCSQSAVSQHVKRLERELGLPLVTRGSRGVVPTHAGRVLWEAATTGIAGIDAATRRLRELATGDTGEVRITTGATSVRHFMGAGIVAFRERFPRVRLEFRTRTSSRDCLAAVLADESELALVTFGDPVPGIERRPLLTLPWALAVSAEDPVAARATIEPGELADLADIGLPGNSTARAQLDAAVGTANRANTSVADWDTAVLLAELGAGRMVVPVMPAWTTARHPALRLVPIPALPPLSAGWACRSWKALSPIAVAFADTVAAALDR